MAAWASAAPTRQYLGVPAYRASRGGLSSDAVLCSVRRMQSPAGGLPTVKPIDHEDSRTVSALLAPKEHPLTVDSATDFLLARRVFGPEHILSGEVRVIEAPRRNRNILIWIGDDRGYVIKQPEPTEPSTADTLTCEARFYQHHHIGDDAPLSNIIPKFVAFEANQSILTLELVADHSTISEVCRAHPVHEFPIALWRRLGATVAKIHNNGDAEALPLSRRCGTPPWAFRAHRPSAGSMRSESAASLAALAAIQAAPALLDCFSTGVSQWEPSVLIHGDLRFDNILAANVASEATGLKLLDWELCQHGDPAWDVACVVAGVVRLWLQTIYLGHHGDENSAVEQSNWSVYQAAIRSFWFGYSAAQRPTIAREKLARFTVLALLQSVLENERYATHLTESSILALQLCENIAADPQLAADDFFALGAPDLRAT